SSQKLNRCDNRLGPDMKIRQLRYFTRVVERGSMGKAAQDFGVVTSALSQQISRLESELSTRLLQRSATGEMHTDAGLAFFRQAQLALRHIDEAARPFPQRHAGNRFPGDIDGNRQCRPDRYGATGRRPCPPAP